jgi:DNA-directed RNA polymerase subunit H (RpoH/RPB5)
MFSEDFEDKIIKVRNTVLEMLEDRGIKKENLPLNLKYSFLKYIINEFKNGKPILDMLVKDENKKIYVKFLNEIERKSSNVEYGNLPEISRIIMESNRLNKTTDSVIIVIFDEEFDKYKFFDTEPNLNKYGNICVFGYKSLLFNITKHPLVPLHEKVSKEDLKDFKKKFMIKSYSNLPSISYADPVCKYYGYQPGDIIKVVRKSAYVKEHVCYRYVSGYIRYKIDAKEEIEEGESNNIE